MPAGDFHRDDPDDWYNLVIMMMMALMMMLTIARVAVWSRESLSAFAMRASLSYR